MRRSLLAVTALALLAAGCTQGSQQPSPGKHHSGFAGGGPVAGARPGSVHWHVCGSSLASLRCASLKVPLDYAKPSGRTITLALSEVPATAAPSKRRGLGQRERDHPPGDRKSVV